MGGTIKVHFGYIIAILVGIIVLLLTLKWGTEPDLVNYLMFALAVTSLFLSVLAIVHAIVSNAGLSSTVTALDTAARKVSDNVFELGRTTETLTGQVKAIPEAIGRVESSVEGLRELVDKKAKEEPAGAGAKVALEPVVQVHDMAGFVNGLAAMAMRQASILGLCALYVSAVAYKTKKSFDPDRVAALYPSKIGKWYTIAYLVALATTGLLEYEWKIAIRLVRVHEQILERISAELDLRYDELKTSNEGARAEQLLAARGAIDSYFAGDDSTRGVVPVFEMPPSTEGTEKK